jgi:hypothetical protein
VSRSARDSGATERKLSGSKVKRNPGGERGQERHTPGRRLARHPQPTDRPRARERSPSRRCRRSYIVENGRSSVCRCSVERLLSSMTRGCRSTAPSPCSWPAKHPLLPSPPSRPRHHRPHRPTPAARRRRRHPARSHRSIVAPRRPCFRGFPVVPFELVRRRAFTQISIYSVASSPPPLSRTGVPLGATYRLIYERWRRGIVSGVKVVVFSRDPEL